MEEIKKDISIIIPCYNTNPGYLQEAVESVLAYKGNYSYEIIIVDDGSVDRATLDLLSNYQRQNIKVFYQENKGPAAARNTGVRNCNSNYLLFLDSDNRILPGYIDEGMNALRLNTKTAVAYGNPAFLEEEGKRNFKPGPFDIKEILIENYIDTCSVVRRKAWEDANGFDEEKILIGHEDWEFWISLFGHGWEFVHIDKTLFEYRVNTNSLITKTTKEDFDEKLGYIFRKHWKVVRDAYWQLYSNGVMYKDDLGRPLRSFIKYSRKKYLG